MTVSETTTSARNEYVGNGVLTVFSFTFEVLEEANLTLNKSFTLKVILEESGTETEQTEDTDYTVTYDSDSRLGTVTFTTAPTATKSIILLSDIPFTQSTDYINIGTGKFPANSHEGTVDKLTLIVRQQAEEIDRAILLPESSELTDITIPVSVANAGKAIVVNAAGDDLDAQSLIDIDLFPVTTFAATILDDETALEVRGTIGLDTTDDVTFNGVTTSNLTVSTAVVASGAIKDEDDMSSDSATALATQQSIKAYTDNNSGFSVFRSSNQSISANTTTLIAFTDETYDLGGEFDSSTNFRFTPTTAGKYIFTSFARLDSLSDQKFYALDIFKNGSASLARAQTYASGTSSPSPSISAIIDMNGTTDYVDVRVFHNDAVAKNINSSFNGFFGHLLLKS